MKRIAVVGGGPGGLTACYKIKEEHPDYQVVLFEKDEMIGKRIKVSGNGRCNLLNININQNDYYNGEKINYILSYFNKYQNKFFSELNLHLYHDEEGRMYPITNSSKTVINAFINALNRKGVVIKLNEKFISLNKNNDKYLLITSCDKYIFDKVIFATGGASYLYKKEDYENIIKSLPYKINYEELSGVLCPIKVKEKINKACVGKRSKAKIYLYLNNDLIYEESGEILFKKDGISGIVIFNISRYIDYKKANLYSIKINFIDGINKNQIDNELSLYSKKEVISSYVVDEIADLILSYYNNVYQGLSSFILHVDSLYSLNESQVTRGGILIEELNNDLSLKKDENIYFLGEMIDVDGKCGGYNIYFALASGYFVGSKI
ncbi:MAG: aminoacetone oxidase family FAD-binding enzyme [Bacilli bacterium]